MRRTSTIVSSATVERALGDSAERSHDCVGLVLPGHRCRREVAPDVLVLGAGHEQHVGPLGGAARTTDLLVVGDGRRRGTEVQDEAEVGLVEAHAEGRGRHEGLDLVVRRASSSRDPFGRLGAPRVGGDLVPGLAQSRRDVLGGGHGQGVDDARPGKLSEVGDEPGETLLRGRQGQHSEPQRRAGQRSAQGEHVAAAGTELLDDVGDDPGVGRRRRGEHRRALGQGREQVADAPVVGPEVVPPVADAVGLVDDEQAARLGERGQLLVAEAGVVEPLGADEQHVDLARREGPGHGAPLVGVGGVEGDGLDAGALGGGDLVAHEGEQRAAR